MIKQLDNSLDGVAIQIFNVFQRSYRVEAELIGVSEFPPLSRTVEEIKNSKTQFYGLRKDSAIAGVIEVSTSEEQLSIDSLVVDPIFFKRGVAGELIKHVLSNIYYRKAIVETALANTPAINLYVKHGFAEFKVWTPSHGIKKVALSLDNEANIR